MSSSFMSPKRRDIEMYRRDAEELWHRAAECAALAFRAHDASLAAELRACAHDLKSRARHMDQVVGESRDE